MKNPHMQKIWHALQAAQVEVVLAEDELPRARAERLREALHEVRVAEARLLDVLTGRATECPEN